MLRSGLPRISQREAPPGVLGSSLVGYDSGHYVREERLVDQQQQSRWRLTRRQVLWIVAAIVLAVLIPIGYAHPWTGFGQTKVAQDVQPSKTLWDWLDLLVVPVVLALGGYLFNRSENLRTQKIADERRQDDRLQAYLDGMSELLTDKDRPLHRAQVGDGLSTVARARTLTVLPRLDGERKRSVVQFLYESGLIARNRVVVYLGGADLRGANLRGASLEGTNLRWADLRGADLRGAHLTEANLFSAILEGTDLIWANLRWAILIWANLSRANLSNAILEGADLRGANLFRADLSNANVSNADVSNAKLSGANLIGADLRWADLSGAQGWTEEQLTIAEVLEGATMPNGQKYEDWLKDKQAQGKDEGNE